jgi:hypothetical protein
MLKAVDPMMKKTVDEFLALYYGSGPEVAEMAKELGLYDSIYVELAFYDERSNDIQMTREQFAFDVNRKLAAMFPSGVEQLQKITNK